MKYGICLYTCSVGGIHSIPYEGTATLHGAEENKNINERLLQKLGIPDFKFFFKQVK